MKTSSVVGKFFGINFVVAKTTPREDSATGGNAQGPEVGSRDKVHAEGLRVLFQMAVFLSREDTVSPEGDECNPAGVTMDCLEVVVIDPTECGVCSSQNEAEHGAQNVGSDKVGERCRVSEVNVVAGNDNSVHDVPHDGGNTSTTVSTTIMENLRETAAKPEWGRMGASNGNLVYDVYEILLTEQEGNHEVRRGGSSNVWCRWPSLVARYKNDERSEVSNEDRAERLAIVGEEDV